MLEALQFFGMRWGHVEDEPEAFAFQESAKSIVALEGPLLTAPSGERVSEYVGFCYRRAFGIAGREPNRRWRRGGSSGSADELDVSFDPVGPRDMRWIGIQQGGKWFAGDGPIESEEAVGTRHSAENGGLDEALEINGDLRSERSEGAP